MAVKRNRLRARKVGETTLWQLLPSEPGIDPVGDEIVSCVRDTHQEPPFLFFHLLPSEPGVDPVNKVSKICKCCRFALYATYSVLEVAHSIIHIIV